MIRVPKDLKTVVGVIYFVLWENYDTSLCTYKQGKFHREIDQELCFDDSPQLDTSIKAIREATEEEIEMFEDAICRNVI